ncbi:bifunctional 5,10-methylenetetrahydrofolate dehydrogenase/5,10-methenyltetrahydrofolate cyclohydrolase [Candidatus Poriferisocius sp.]|uniref:bifunctional 5,10-methylenetetrahydrofolate dehydrogenase/5,10-methenyltetrahydrofolate cyclohydrolase n=1 Tax=Candidatus Poriferisocius sp. TaxID=3101276 RepID=UPI003B01A3AE
MAVIKLDGELLAAEIKDVLKSRIAVLAERGRTPGLGTLLVGDDGPSANYVAMKHRDCQELGMVSREVHLPAGATQVEVDAVVDDFNADPVVDAYIMQYPFPGHLDYEAALMRVEPAKDADGLHPVNLGRLVQGVDAPLACTPAGIQLLLERYEVPIAGRHVVIIGRGLTIGRPLANLLSLKRPNANAVVTVVHTGAGHLAAHTRTADILIAAAGSPRMVTADMVKPGAAVVAAGVSFVDGKLVSDVDDDVAEVAGWLSPRIGGVGPMTRTMLMSNTVTAAEQATG